MSNPLTHSFKAVDPPGTANRRWECVTCGRRAVGIAGVNAVPCERRPGPRESEQLIVDAIEGKGKFAHGTAGEGGGE